MLACVSWFSIWRSKGKLRIYMLIITINQLLWSAVTFIFVIFVIISNSTFLIITQQMGCKFINALVMPGFCFYSSKLYTGCIIQKVKLSMYPLVSPVCDWCIGAERTLAHTFWLCSKVSSSWKDIFYWCTRMFYMDIIADTELALLVSSTASLSLS